MLMHILWNSILLLPETLLAFLNVTAVIDPKEGSGSVSADVNYLEEFQKGGSVGIALAILLLAMIGFTVERLFRLRAKSICPHGLVTKVLPMWSEGDFMEIVKTCKMKPSLLAKMVLYFVEHRKADPELLIPGANDIAVRGLRRHTQRTYSLAVVAALAPLLGLLGTMIGIIESFKLVELYGDEGGDRCFRIHDDQFYSD